MKPARVAVLLIALVAAAGAALLARNLTTPEVSVVEAPARTLDTVEVLVASKDVPLGHVVSPADLRWQEWPQAAANGDFIRKDAEPDALESYEGAIARVAMQAGEPVNATKLVRSDTAGFMSAILPEGMRAISIKISPETGAGGFILPRDRVDVILTRRMQDPAGRGAERFVSSTVLTNVRVLAIDQQVSEVDGKKEIIGKTATLELKPEQAESLALAESMGVLSLALRSLRDSDEGGGDGPRSSGFGGGSGTVTIVRFGNAASVRPGS